VGLLFSQPLRYINNKLVTTLLSETLVQVPSSESSGFNVNIISLYSVLINLNLVSFHILKAASVKMTVFWDVEQCSSVDVHHCLIVLKMEATSTSETSAIFYQTTRRNILEKSPSKRSLHCPVTYAITDVIKASTRINSVSSIAYITCLHLLQANVYTTLNMSVFTYDNMNKLQSTLAT
jgi:hypothetical protein